MKVKENIYYWFDRLEITCSNNNCEHFNLIYISELEVNKKFTCDECNETILMVDEELISLKEGK
tara:strand:- start:1968 stop:2159 length:192 start_codon:yes stop_codon:yes gene_type:complete